MFKLPENSDVLSSQGAREFRGRGMWVFLKGTRKLPPGVSGVAVEDSIPGGETSGSQRTRGDVGMRGMQQGWRTRLGSLQLKKRKTDF